MHTRIHTNIKKIANKITKPLHKNIAFEFALLTADAAPRASYVKMCMMVKIGTTLKVVLSYARNVSEANYTIEVLPLWIIQSLGPNRFHRTLHHLRRLLNVFPGCRTNEACDTYYTYGETFSLSHEVPDGLITHIMILECAINLQITLISLRIPIFGESPI